MNIRAKVFLTTLLGLAIAGPAAARDFTAFQLVKAGDPFVGVQSKDMVLQIRSEKSVASLIPDVWHVVY